MGKDQWLKGRNGVWGRTNYSGLPEHEVTKIASQDPPVGNDNLLEALCCKVLYLLAVTGTWDSLEDQRYENNQYSWHLKSQYPNLLSCF